MPPIHTLPADYVERAHVVLTDDALLLKLNVLSLVPLLIMAALLLPYWALTAPLHPLYDVAINPVVGIIATIVIVLPLHELIHGAAIIWCGHRARFGMKLAKGVIYATADNALFTRDQYNLVALAPLVVITLLALLIVPFVATMFGLYIVIAAVLNAGGAIGDLWAFNVVRRYDRAALVRDEADGFRIFTPNDQGSA